MQTMPPGCKQKFRHWGVLSVWDMEINTCLRSRNPMHPPPNTGEEERHFGSAVELRGALKILRLQIHRDYPGQWFRAGISRRLSWQDRQCIDR